MRSIRVIIGVLLYYLCSDVQAAPTDSTPSTFAPTAVNSAQALEYIEFAAKEALPQLRKACQKVPFAWPCETLVTHLNLILNEISVVCEQGPVTEEQLMPLVEVYNKLVNESKTFIESLDPEKLEKFLTELIELDWKMHELSDAQHFQLSNFQYAITEEQMMRIKKLEGIILKAIHERHKCTLQRHLEVIRTLGICRTNANNTNIASDTSASGASFVTQRDIPLANKTSNEQIRNLAQQMFEMLEEPLSDEHPANPWKILEESIGTMWRGIHFIEQVKQIPAISIQWLRQRCNALLREIRDCEVMTSQEVMRYVRRIEEFDEEMIHLFSQNRAVPMIEEQSSCLAEIEDAVVRKEHTRRQVQLQKWLDLKEPFPLLVPPSLKEAKIPEDSDKQWIGSLDHSLETIKKLIDTASDAIMLLANVGKDVAGLDLLGLKLKLQLCNGMVDDAKERTKSNLTLQEELKLEGTKRHLMDQMQKVRQQIGEQKLVRYLLCDEKCPLNTTGDPEYSGGKGAAAAFFRDWIPDLE